MDVKKLIDAQNKRIKEIERIFEHSGTGVSRLRDKIRIEGKDRLLQNIPNLALSACCVVTWNRYSGHFRYIEFYNKKTLKLAKRSYIISDKNDRQIRIYDDSHGRFHYHDVEYDGNGKVQKVNRVDFNGSLEIVVSDCIRLLKEKMFEL